MTQAKVFSNKEIASQTREIVLVSESPLFYKPGQYITLLIPKEDGSKDGRSYSVASQKDANTISLLVRIIDGGLGSTYIKDLHEGDVVSFVGPSGKFLLSPISQDSLFVATGTGAAPFMPMIDALLKTGNNAVTLLLGFRYEEDSFFKYMTQQWENIYSHFQGIEILSQPSERWQGEKGHVTDYLKRHPAIVLNKQLYICGNGEMVKEVITLAQQQGLLNENIFYEKY
jgi:NAD(P)H-flavin reductase